MQTLASALPSNEPKACIVAGFFISYSGCLNPFFQTLFIF
ncbi:hypothetical protein VCHENC03_1597 [Vibrio sp. HENC-03]|nr:hypothetical protein VCHENC03_1597 [Vibrio sp. HENC-03]